MTVDVEKRAAFLGLARRYARRRVARELDGLVVAGLDAAREAVRAAPVILAANHVAWWDVFLLVLLDEALGTDGFALMDQGNLARLRFFGWLGAIPLDVRRPLGGLRVAARLLDRPGRAVWIFPQGRQRPAHLRPLGFASGVATLTRLAPAATVIPVGVTYAFRESPHPAALVSLGRPRRSDPGRYPGIVAEVEGAVEAELSRIDGHLRGRPAGFDALIAPRGAGAPAGLGSRLLARWAGADP